MLISWVIEWSKSRMPHRRTFRNATHRAWAIWDLSYHHLFGVIPDPGSQMRVTLSLESFCKMPFQARACDVKMPELRQHSSNRVMAWFVNSFATFRGTWDRPDKNPGPLARCQVDIFLNITNCEIQGQACWLPKTLVMWVLSDAHMTGTIVAPAWSWSCLSNHKSPMFILL